MRFKMPTENDSEGIDGLLAKRKAEGKQFNPVLLGRFDYDEARLPTKASLVVRLSVTALVGVALLVSMSWGEVRAGPGGGLIASDDRIISVATFVAIYFFYGPIAIWKLPERSVFVDVRFGAIVGGIVGFVVGLILVVSYASLPLGIVIPYTVHGTLVGIVSAIVLRVTCKLVGVQSFRVASRVGTHADPKL